MSDAYVCDTCNRVGRYNSTANGVKTEQGWEVRGLLLDINTMRYSWEPFIGHAGVPGWAIHRCPMCSKGAESTDELATKIVDRLRGELRSLLASEITRTMKDPPDPKET